MQYNNFSRTRDSHSYGRGGGRHRGRRNNQSERLPVALQQIVDSFRNNNYEKLYDVEILDTLEGAFSNVSTSQIRGIYQRFLKISKIKGVEAKRRHLFMLYVLVQYKNARKLLKGAASLFLLAVFKELLRLNKEDELNTALEHARQLFETIVALSKK